MAKLRTIQILRGTTAQNNSYTGSAGELTMDTTTNEVRVHDGSTAGGHKIGTKIDNSTITANASDEIQAVAVIDQNSGIAKTWTGTMAEYEAIVTKDPETEYIITDDIGGSATEIGEITEALNNKVDKGHQVVEFQAPTAANDYTWYRKYSDGWVEQGGFGTLPKQNANTAAAARLNLPIQMADSTYASAWERTTDGGNTADLTQISNYRTTTYIDVYFWSIGTTNGPSTICITVQGMAA